MAAPSIYVGIELARELRVGAQGLLSPASREVGGVNLLRHAIKLGLEVAPAENIQVLAVDTDAALLDIVNEFGVREVPPMQWIGGLVDRAATAQPDDAVVILRQLVPLRDAADIRRALGLIRKQRCVLPAVKGGEKEPDPTPCRAFEVWRLSEFSKYTFGGTAGDRDQPLLIDAASFVEINRPSDEPRAARLLNG